MRGAFLVFLVLLAPLAGALPDEEKGVVKSEEFNFEIRIPKFSPDWRAEEITKDQAAQGLKSHFVTEYADSSPLASAHVYVSVIPLSKDFARKSLDRIAKTWGPAMEEHLSNPRERSEEAYKFGEVPGYKVDVKGDHLAGIHQRTWFVAKNGKLMYLIYIDRNYRAVGDEDLEEEIQEILGSFKFLRVEKVQADSKAPKKDKGPGVGGADSKKEKEKIDPELLKKETFKEPFWRFTCVKPQGLLKRKLADQDKKYDIKYWFQNDVEGSRCYIRIYAQTDKAKKFTLEQLKDFKMGYWEKEVKVSKDPVIDTNYKKKFPLAKKAIRIELVGRSTTTIRRIYLLAECKNDRQYQIEIYLTGTNARKVWDKKVQEFIKNFKPTK